MVRRSPWKTTARAIAWTGIGAVVTAACGSPDRPPLLDGVYSPPRSTSDAGASFADGGSAAPKCQYDGDGGPCGCLELSLLTDAPNLYFVLDRSTSMNDGDKWMTIRTVLSQVAMRLGPRGRFGAAVYPDPATNDCAPGVEVLAPRPGDSPAGIAGETTKALIHATNVPAIGGTPTAASLSRLTPRITSFGERTFVILATDGGPNCNGAAACGIPACIPNIESIDGCAPNGGTNCCDPSLFGPLQCLDADPALAAVAALRDAGVPTYVVGVPGSGPYGGLLDRLAEAGGTARAASPKYYRVDSDDAAAFAQALGAVAAKITATCDLTLSPAPEDPSEVNVYLDDAVVAQDPVDGWKLDGSTVTLLGKTCDRVLAGDVLNLRVIAGCPTVAPK